MDMSRAFKSSVQKVIGNPVIIADRFHFMRQGYWALDRIRREVQIKEIRKTLIPTKQKTIMVSTRET